MEERVDGIPPFYRSTVCLKACRRVLVTADLSLSEGEVLSYGITGLAGSRDC